MDQNQWTWNFLEKRILGLIHKNKIDKRAGVKPRVDLSHTRLWFPRVSKLSAPVLPTWRITGKQMILHLPSFSLVNKGIWRQPWIYVLLFFSRPNLFNAVLCLVTQSCPTLCNPMDGSPPGSSVHGDSPGKNAEVGCHALFQLIQ